MVTIKQYYHLHEVYIDKATLELEGINSFIINENSFTIKPDGFQPNVLLQVANEDAERAVEILNSLLEEE